MSLSDFRGGRGRGGFRGSRSRGGPHRGGGFRGGYSDRGDRGGFRGRGRGDGYSRGGPPRRMSRDDMSPPRKAPLLSKSYDSRRADHYDDEDDYNDRPIAPRSRDTYSSQLSRDRLNSRDKGYSTRGSRGRYPSARGDYSPVRESSSYRDSYNDRKESYRTSGREYMSPRSSDYRAERLPRESPREYASSRDYSQSSREFREPLRDDFRDLPPRDRYESDLSPRRSSYMDRGLRDDSPYREDTRREYSSRTFSSRMSDRPPRDYPPSREYRGRGAPRGSIRGGRDFYSNGRGSRGGPYRSRGGPPRGRGGPPRGRGGRPDYYPRDGGRRSLSPGGRGGILGKRRLSPDDGYRR